MNQLQSTLPAILAFNIVSPFMAMMSCMSIFYSYRIGHYSGFLQMRSLAHMHSNANSYAYGQSHLISLALHILCAARSIQLNQFLCFTASCMNTAQMHDRHFNIIITRLSTDYYVQPIPFYA